MNQTIVRLLTLPTASMSNRSGAGMLRIRGVIGDLIGCVSCVGEGGLLWAESVQHGVSRWVVPCEYTM